MRFSDLTVISLFATVVFASKSRAEAAAIVAAAVAAADQDVDPSPSEDTVKDVITDAGILSRHVLADNNLSPSVGSSSRMLVPGVSPPLCADYVNCDNGFVSGDSSTTCAAACGGNCCVGGFACGEFTGKVCKDGSCTGSNACFGANIPWVKNSCKGGNFACDKAGNFGVNGGSVGTMINSCIGLYSCPYMGYNGVGGNLLDSCVGEKSCYWAGSNQGSIGSITSSCTGFKACYKAGRDAASAIASNMNNCCNTDNECAMNSEATLPAICLVRDV